MKRISRASIPVSKMATNPSKACFWSASNGLPTDGIRKRLS